MPVTVDPTLLPTATRQLPNWSSYLALNVLSQSHGYNYTDPVSGLTVTKITDAAWPVASDQWRLDYANGGPNLSRVWTGGDGKERVTVMAFGSGGRYFIDVQLAARLSENPRVAPFALQQLASSFSQLAATPRVWFGLDGNILRKYDTSTMTEIVAGHFPKDLTASCPYLTNTWLMHSVDETWFGLTNATEAVGDSRQVFWNTSTNTVLIFDASITAGMNPLDGVNEGYPSPTGRYLVTASNGLDDATGTPAIQVYDTVTGKLSARYLLSNQFIQFSHDAILWDGTNEYIVACDPGGSVLQLCVMPLVPITANGQVLTASDVITGQNSEHSSAQWVDNNTGGWVFGYNVDDGLLGLNTPTLSSGAIYTFNVTGLGTFGYGVIGVRQVLITNGAGHITGELTAAASLGAMTAGTFFQATPSSTTLYVWMPDSSAPTTSKVFAYAPGKVHDGLLTWKRDGSDLRLVCHTYGACNQGTNYAFVAFAPQSPDGRVAVFGSSMGRDFSASDIRTDLFLVALPTTGGAGGGAPGPAWLLARFNREHRN